MASVSSLDQDMRKLRLDRYTPQAADEVKSWIEETLGEHIPPGDLLEFLKDGVVLCKQANIVITPPGIKYKASSMPFVQMENISHFLRACEMPPLRLPAHDRFLTVDLYDGKDPAQVIQCLSAFSRAANAVDPSRVRTSIGPKRGAVSPRKGTNGLGLNDSSTRTSSHVSQLSGSGSPALRPESPATMGTPERTTRYGSPSVSSWSKKSDETSSIPAWNIHQYGYMGGASQGNQGINFGARRQIVSQSPQIPSLAEKEKKRKEQEEEAERQRQEALEAEKRSRAEEEQERHMEEQRHEEDTRSARERERQELEREKRKWAEEERRWKEEDERRKREMEQEAKRLPPATLETTLQDLSQNKSDAIDRIQELERQLEEAKQRERQYQSELERERERERDNAPDQEQSQELPTNTVRLTKYDVEQEDIVREFEDEEPQTTDNQGQNLRQEWDANQAAETPTANESQPLADEALEVNAPEIQSAPAPPQTQQVTNPPAQSPKPERQRPTPAPKPSFTQPRPLPDPRPYFPTSTTSNRTDRFLATNPAPQTAVPRTHAPQEMGMTSTSERDAEDARRVAGQAKTKAGGWASKSLLEKEMEKERERQKEWEEAQVERMRGAGGGRSGGLHGPRELKR